MEKRAAARAASRGSTPGWWAVLMAVAVSAAIVVLFVCTYERELSKSLFFLFGGGRLPLWVADRACAALCLVDPLTAPVVVVTIFEVRLEVWLALGCFRFRCCCCCCCCGGGVLCCAAVAVGGTRRVHAFAHNQSQVSSEYVWKMWKTGGFWEERRCLKLRREHLSVVPVAFNWVSSPDRGSRSATPYMARFLC